MNYYKTILASWKIVKERPYLWRMGIVAALTGGSTVRLLNISDPTGTSSRPSPIHYDGRNITDSIPQSLSLVKIKDNISQTIDWWQSWYPSSWPYFTIAIVFLILILALVIYFSLLAQAGLIVTANKELDGNHQKENKVLGYGQKSLISFLTLKIIVILSVSIYLGLISAPYFAVRSSDPSAALSTFFGIIMILGILLLFPLSLYLGVLVEYAARYIVIGHIGIKNSLSKAHKLLLSNFKESFYGWFAQTILTIVFSVIILSIFGLCVTILSLIGLIVLSLVGNIAAIVFAVIFGLALLLIILLLVGFTTSLLSIYWTSIFKKLTGE